MNIREITGCLLVLCLLLGEQCGESSNVGVDGLFADSAALVCRHDELDFEANSCGMRGIESNM